MSKYELAKYRMKKGRETLEDAEDAFNRDRYMLSVNSV